MRLIVAALLFASTLGAQEETPHSHTPRKAFLMEVSAGAFGSFVGMVPVMFAANCFSDAHYDDSIDCKQPLVLGVFVASPAATTLGVNLTARHTGTSRSLIGAWVGAIAGGATGLALANALDRSGTPPAVTFPLYYVTQATMSVLGSRVGGRLRKS